MVNIFTALEKKSGGFTMDCVDVAAAVPPDAVVDRAAAKT